MKKRGALLLTAALAILILLAGCGKKTPSAPSEPGEPGFTAPGLTERYTPNGMLAISLPDNWERDDGGDEYILSARAANDSHVIILYQLEKLGGFSVKNLAEVKTAIDVTYNLTGNADLTGVEIPGLRNVTAFRGQMDYQGVKGEAVTIYGESNFAWYAILYHVKEWNDDASAILASCCATFREECPKEDNATTVELTDTVLWMNAAHAILTAQNGWETSRFAGLPANDESASTAKALLAQSMDITDRASADAALAELLESGHRASFAADMKLLDDNGAGKAEDLEKYFSDSFSGIGEDTARRYTDLFRAYKDHGERAIDAWDYSRAIDLVSCCYLAGFYTESEALDKSLEIAKELQSAYASWDELVDGYLFGYEYWSEKQPTEPRAVYERLRASANDPYYVDYSTSLDKTW